MSYTSKNPRFNSATLGGTKDASALLDLTSTTQGLGFPNMTTAQRDAISTPKDGLTIYNTDTDKLNYYDGASWKDVGAGSGTGEINYIENPDAEEDTAGWVTYDDGASATPVDGTGGVSANLTLTSQNTTVLRGSYSFKLAKGAADAQGEGASYDFTIDKADQQKLLKIEFDYNTDGTYADDDLAVYIYDVTNAALITPSVTGITGWDKDNDGSGKALISFSSTDSSSYRLIFHVTSTSTSAYDFYFDNIIVGPGSVVTGAAVGPVSLTPTFNNDTGLTVSTSNLDFTRQGEHLIIDGVMTLTGTGTDAGQLSITLGNLTASGSPRFSGGVIYQEQTTNNTQQGSLYDLNNGNIGFYFAKSGVALAAVNGTDFGNVTSGDIDTIFFNSVRVKIAEWAGSGTVNLGANDVEYAYNTDLTDADDTSSFAYGPGGTRFPSGAFTATRQKRVRFQTPIQPTDRMYVEINTGSGWIPIENNPYNSTLVTAMEFQNGGYYGVGINDVVNDTDVDVRLGRFASSNGTYGSTGTSWASVASTVKWRVVKHRAGIPVGFSTSNATQSGLAPSGVFGSENQTINLQARSTTPTDPTSSSDGKIYVKGGLLVIQYNDSGTVRYKYLDLTGTGVTWVHTTTAP